jgi:hypothetical protein
MGMVALEKCAAGSEPPPGSRDGAGCKPHYIVSSERDGEEFFLDILSHRIT